MKKLLERVEEFWCVNMHGRPMWPVHGHYHCRVCMREFPVQFEVAREERAPQGAAGVLRHGWAG